MRFYHRRLTQQLVCILLCISAVMFSTTYAEAKEQRYYFDHLNTSNSDLSYNCVNGIIQDSRGFIWFGTSYGLNRYDGVSFRNFHKRELNSVSDFIISLCEDQRGNIWIGTDRGVIIYDFESDKFINFDLKSDISTVIGNKVPEIKCDKNGLVWIAVNSQGLFSYDPSTEELKNYFYKNGRQTIPANISSFCFGTNNECYLSLYFSNLYSADREFQSLTPVSFGGVEHFKGENVVDIIKSPHDTFYVASSGKGLCEISPRHDKFSVLIPNNTKYTPELISIDHNKKVWVTTNQGVYLYDTNKESCQHIVANSSDRFSLSGNHIVSVMVDSANGVWLGSATEGVAHSSQLQYNFEKLYAIGDQSLEGVFVKGFENDGEGLIWIPTKTAGLLSYSLKTKQLHRYNKCRLPDNLVCACYHNGQLWLGAESIYRLDIKSGRLKNYSRSDGNTELRDNKIFTIVETSKGLLLVGTTLGMLRYNHQSDSFAQLPGLENVFVTDVTEDVKGNLWLATYANGLIHYNVNRECVIRIYNNDPKDDSSLPSNKVLDVFMDSLGQIWAATFGGGFCKFDDENSRFEIYNTETTEGLLKSDIAFNIVEDNANSLWVPMGRGLVRFNDSNKDLSVYTTDDGMLEDEFSNGTKVSVAGESIFVGSANGFVRFNYNTLNDNETKPYVLINSFYLDNKEVKPSKQESSLEKHIDLTRSIHLAADENSFGFDFSLLGSASPSSDKINYMLEGYDESWRTLTSSNGVYWSNVPAGSYTLRVRGVNSRGTWGEEHDPIRIVVDQYFYRSRVAIVLYVLILIVIIFISVRNYSRRAIANERQYQEELKRAQEIEVINEKITFFSNIVNEIKMLQNMIRMPLQNVIISNTSETVSEDLHIINENTERLSQLVQESMDFVNIEHHNYILEYNEFDLIEKIEFLLLNLSGVIQHNNLHFDFCHSDEPLMINADEAGVDKILKNLLSSGIKYAKSRVAIVVEQQSDEVVITIKNDGNLIPEKQRENIFNPIFQYSENRRSLDLLHYIELSSAYRLAELHEGAISLCDQDQHTNFVLTLPLKHILPDASQTEEGQEKSALDTTLPILLIVEEQKEFTDYMRRKLNNEYFVLEAASAEVALSILKSYDVNLVIVDVTLKGVSGFELCRYICDDFSLSNTPVILISALSSVKSKIRGVECGAQLYLEKPFSLDYLRACINNIIAKSLRDRDHQQEEDDEIISNEMPQQLYELRSRNSRFIEKLDSVIIDNLSDPELSNSFLAEAMHQSTSTLNRRVRMLFGTSTNDYIRTKRLEIAMQILASGSERINEICYTVGFNTPSYFAKCFKKRYGVTPAEYQKETQGDID